jgi:hypothetical protein
MDGFFQGSPHRRFTRDVKTYNDCTAETLKAWKLRVQRRKKPTIDGAKKEKGGRKRARGGDLRQTG